MTGTRKSYLIGVLHTQLQILIPDKNIVVRAAPTWDAADEIEGETLNILLIIPFTNCQTELLVLSPSNLEAMRTKLKDMKYMLIDQRSMVGLRTLNWVDLRLREVFPEYKDEYFGGRSILLVGDFYALQPEVESPLWSRPETIQDECERAARNAYLAINKTVELKNFHFGNLSGAISQSSGTASYKLAYIEILSWP